MIFKQKNMNQENKTNVKSAFASLLIATAAVAGITGAVLCIADLVSGLIHTINQ